MVRRGRVAARRGKACQYKARLIMNQPEAEIQSHICKMLSFRRVCYSVTDASRTWGKNGRPRPGKVAPGWP